jgi:GNAT superfamily N-acetyltransferase
MTMKSSSSSSSSSRDNIKKDNKKKKYTVHTVSTHHEKEAILPALARLSADTEMNSYAVEQWRFLLCAGNVEAFVIYRPAAAAAAAAAEAEAEDDKTIYNSMSMEENVNRSIWGCVLKIPMGRPSHFGYGMMLVSREARGQGLARRLLETAMMGNETSISDDCYGTDGNNLPGLHILGTCTEMGRPMYEKLGFERVSTVRRMVVDIERLSFLPKHNAAAADGASTTYSMWKHRVKIEKTLSQSSSRAWKDILDLDRHATGLDRSEMLRAIQGYPYVSTAIISVDTNGTDEDGSNTTKVVMAAMLTQYPESSTVVVGPIVGDENRVPMLLEAIRNHYCPVDAKESTNNHKTKAVTQLALIVSDHPSLVETLTKAGFETQFELGAMTQWGRPLPGNRDSYLAIIHPTLG